MKYYLSAILFVAAFLGIAAIVSSVTNQRFFAARERLGLAEKSLETSERTLKLRKTQFETEKRNGKEVTKFLAEWGMYTREGANPGEVGSVLGELAHAVGILSNRRPTPRREDYPFGSAIIPVQMVAYSVNGDYRLALDWLGKAEDRFPFARTESVTITGSGVNEVEMLVNLAFPLEKEPTK